MPNTNFPNGITTMGFQVAQGLSQTAAAVMSNNLVCFTIAGGPIEITSLVSQCVTANDTTASTMQWKSAGTLGTVTGTITGASATLASAVVGTLVTAPLTALTTAPVINANGVGVVSNPNSIVIPAGTLFLVIGVGSTVGTWQHFLQYIPLGLGVTVTNAF